MNFIEYLKSLSPEDWKKRITDKWTVNDVVAHLVGWEKESVKVLKNFLVTGEANPWFLKTDNYDEFNEEAVNFYKDYSCAKLLEEWEQWQRAVADLIGKIGEKNLRE